MSLPLQVEVAPVVIGYNHSHGRVARIGPRRGVRRTEAEGKRQLAVMTVSGDGERLVLTNRDNLTFPSGLGGTVVAVNVYSHLWRGAMRLPVPDWSPQVVEGDEVLCFAAGGLRAEGTRQRRGR